MPLQWLEWELCPQGICLMPSIETRGGSLPAEPPAATEPFLAPSAAPSAPVTPGPAPCSRSLPEEGAKVEEEGVGLGVGSVSWTACGRAEGDGPGATAGLEQRINTAKAQVRSGPTLSWTSSKATTQHSACPGWEDTE